MKGSAQALRVVPYYAKRNDYKIILDKKISEGFRKLTGRNRVTSEDEKALLSLGLKMVGVDTIAKSI